MPWLLLCCVNGADDEGRAYDYEATTSNIDVNNAQPRRSHSVTAVRSTPSEPSNRVNGHGGNITDSGFGSGVCVSESQRTNTRNSAIPTAGYQTINDVPQRSSLLSANSTNYRSSVRSANAAVASSDPNPARNNESNYFGVASVTPYAVARLTTTRSDPDLYATEDSAGGISEVYYDEIDGMSSGAARRRSYPLYRRFSAEMPVDYNTDSSSDYYKLTARERLSIVRRRLHTEHNGGIHNEEDEVYDRLYESVNTERAGAHTVLFDSNEPLSAATVDDGSELYAEIGGSGAAAAAVTGGKRPRPIPQNNSEDDILPNLPYEEEEAVYSTPMHPNDENSPSRCNTTSRRPVYAKINKKPVKRSNTVGNQPTDTIRDRHYNRFVRQQQPFRPPTTSSFSEVYNDDGTRSAFVNPSHHVNEQNSIHGDRHSAGDKRSRNRLGNVKLSAGYSEIGDLTPTSGNTCTPTDTVQYSKHIMPVNQTADDDRENCTSIQPYASARISEPIFYPLDDMTGIYDNHVVPRPEQNAAKKPHKCPGHQRVHSSGNTVRVYHDYSSLRETSRQRESLLTGNLAAGQPDTAEGTSCSAPNSCTLPEVNFSQLGLRDVQYIDSHELHSEVRPTKSEPVYASVKKSGNSNKS